MHSRAQTHARGASSASFNKNSHSQGRKGKTDGGNSQPTRPHSGGSHPQQSPMSPQQQNYQNLFVAKVPDHIRQEDIMAVFVEGLRRVNSLRVSVKDKTCADLHTGDAHHGKSKDGPKQEEAEKGQSESASAPCAKLVPPPFDVPNPVSAMVSLDPATGVSKGFGFALFPDNETGMAAHKAMNNVVVVYNHVTKRVLNIWFPGEESERKFKEREKQLKKSAKAAGGARKGGVRGAAGVAKSGAAVVPDLSPPTAAVAADDNLNSGSTPALNNALFNVVDEGVSITPWRLVLTGSRFDGTTAAAASPCLYVRNIPLSMQQTEVGDLLGRFGNVVFCAVRHDHSQRPIWVVFVEYDSIDSATKALNELHGNHQLFPEASAPILAKYADTQEQREQRKLMRGGAAGTNSVGIIVDSSHKSSLSCEPQHGSFGGGANSFVGDGSNPQLSPQHEGGLTTLHVCEETKAATKQPLQHQKVQYTYATSDLSARAPHASFYQSNNNNNMNTNTNHNNNNHSSLSYSNYQHHHDKQHSQESNAMFFSPTPPFNQHDNFQQRIRTHHQHHQPNHVAPEEQANEAAAHSYNSTSRNGAATAPYSHQYRHHDHYQQQRNTDGSYSNSYNSSYYTTFDHHHPSAAPASSTSISTPFVPASYHHHHEGNTYPTPTTTNHYDTEKGAGANGRGHNHDGERPSSGRAHLLAHHLSSSSSSSPPPPPHSHTFLPAGGSTSSPPTALFDHQHPSKVSQTRPQQSFIPPSSSHSYNNNNNNNMSDYHHQQQYSHQQYQQQQQQQVKVANTHTHTNTNRGAFLPTFSSFPAHYSSLQTPSTVKSNSSSVNVHANHSSNNNESGPHQQQQQQQHIYQHQQYNNSVNNYNNKQTAQASLPRPASGGSGAAAFAALASGGNSNANLFSVPVMSAAPTTTTSSASNNSVLPIEINIYAPRESGHSSRSAHNTAGGAPTAACDNCAPTNVAGVTHYNKNNLALFLSTSSDTTAPTVVALDNDTEKRNNNDNEKNNNNTSGRVSTCTETTHIDDETCVLQEVTDGTSKAAAVRITQTCKSASENGNACSSKNDSGLASTNGGDDDQRDEEKEDPTMSQQQHQHVARRGPSITIPLENTNIPRGEAGGVPQHLSVHLPNPSLHDAHNNSNRSTNELSLGESEMMMLTGGGAVPTSRPPTRPGSGVGATGTRPQAPLSIRGEGSPNNAGQRLGFRNPYSAAATPKNSVGNSVTSFVPNNTNSNLNNNNGLGGECMGTPTRSSPVQHTSPSHYRFNPYDRASPLVATTRDVEGSTSGGAFGGGNSYSNENSRAATPTAAASLANSQVGTYNRMRAPLNSGSGIRQQQACGAPSEVAGEMASLTMCGSTFAMDTAVRYYSVKSPASGTGGEGGMHSGNNNNKSNCPPQQLMPSHHSLPATPFSGPLNAHSPHTVVGTPSAMHHHQQQLGGSSTSLSPTPTAGSATGLGVMRGQISSGRGGCRGGATYNNSSSFYPNSNQQHHNYFNTNNANRSPSAAASHSYSHSHSAATPHGPAVNITIPSNWDAFAATTPMAGAGFGAAPPIFAADESQLHSHRNNYYAEEQGPHARREQFSNTPLQHRHDLHATHARSDVALRAMSGDSVYSNPANATGVGADDNPVTSNSNNNANIQMLFNNDSAPTNSLISQYMQQGNIRPNSGAPQGSGKPRGGAPSQQQRQHGPSSGGSSRPVSGSQPQQSFSTTIPATHGGVLRPMWAKGIEWEAVKK